MADGIARAGWDLDFKHGTEREIRLATIMNLGKVEVKSDGIACRTGRIFVEYEHKGRPSGLAVTTAGHWAFEISDDVWLILPTERLRSAAARAYNSGMTSKGGDCNTTAGALVPVDWTYRV